jgi:uncharacterized protein (DUF924 family)
MALWFEGSRDFDREIAERFAPAIELAAAGELDDWHGDARSALALVLCLDQFPRNVFRGSSLAFESDALALEVALASIAVGHDSELPPLAASIFYLPLEHAEDLAQQELGVELFEALEQRAPVELADLFASFCNFARRHREVIRRFGRFPHRNAVLGRVSSDAEERYLRAGGDDFGGHTRASAAAEPAGDD